jgi:PTS system ascorbate-specific IIB component
MKTILVVCSSGLGTSLMIRLHLESILRKYGVQVNVQHTDMASLHTFNATIVIGARQIIEAVEQMYPINGVALDNIIDRQYIENTILQNQIFREWVNQGGLLSDEPNELDV